MAILENPLDLELILEDPVLGFLIHRGIQIETARRFICDINGRVTGITFNGLDQTDGESVGGAE